MPSNYNRISTCFWWRLTAARWVHTSAAEERALANRKFSPGPQVKADRDTHARVCTRSIALAQGHPLDAAAWRNRAIRRESVKGTLKMAPKTCLLGIDVHGGYAELARRSTGWSYTGVVPTMEAI